MILREAPAGTGVHERQSCLLSRQLRAPGGDPPREDLLPLWIKGLFAVQAVVLLPMGVLMFVAPGLAGPMWPWPLTDLTSVILAAWCLALGALAAEAIWEDDFGRVWVALAGYPVLALLRSISLVRFGDDVQWSEPGAWIYAGVISCWCGLGVWGYLQRRRRSVASERAMAAVAAT